MAREEKKSIEAWEEELERLADAEEWWELDKRANQFIAQHANDAYGYHLAIVAATKLKDYKKTLPR